MALSPARLIADLDAALSRRGEDVVIRRSVGTGASIVNTDVNVRGRVMPVAPNELVGTVSQTDLKVILSPTQIDAAQWPGGVPYSTSRYQVDPRVPKIGDKAILQGKPRDIKFAKPITDGGGTLVRIELIVTG